MTYLEFSCHNENCKIGSICPPQGVQKIFFVFNQHTEKIFANLVLLRRTLLQVSSFIMASTCYLDFLCLVPFRLENSFNAIAYDVLTLPSSEPSPALSRVLNAGKGT